jgi:hypothetical protein
LVEWNFELKVHILVHFIDAETVEERPRDDQQTNQFSHYNFDHFRSHQGIQVCIGSLCPKPVVLQTIGREDRHLGAYSTDDVHVKEDKQLIFFVSWDLLGVSVAPLPLKLVFY